MEDVCDGVSIVAQPVGEAREYVDGYEMRADNGDYTPNEHERLLIEDAIRGYFDVAPEQSQLSERTRIREAVLGLTRWDYNQHLGMISTTDGQGYLTVSAVLAAIDDLG